MKHEPALVSLVHLGCARNLIDSELILGRMAEDSDGDPARAIALYDEYLAAGGPFSQEALGRKMMAVKRSRGEGAARPVAQVYLDRYPEGSYAKVARAMLEAP